MSGAQVVFVRATLAGMALFAVAMARRALPAAALQRRRRTPSPAGSEQA
jgi:hypothetical protein